MEIRDKGFNDKSLIGKLLRIIREILVPAIAKDVILHILAQAIGRTFPQNQLTGNLVAGSWSLLVTRASKVARVLRRKVLDNF
jgi:hypothetical protein